MKVINVYDDGTMIDPEVVAMTPTDYAIEFQKAIRNVQAISMLTGYHTKASMPQTIMTAFKNIIALSFGSGYRFARLDELEKAGASQ